MTITPVAVKAPAPSGGTSSSDSGVAAGFADLVQQHLESGGLPAEGTSRVLDEAASPSATPSDGLAAMLAGLVAAGTTGGGAAGAATVDAGSASGTAAVEGAATPVVAGAAGVATSAAAGVAGAAVADGAAGVAAAGEAEGSAGAGTAGLPGATRPLAGVGSLPNGSLLTGAVVQGRAAAAAGTAGASAAGNGLAAAAAGTGGVGAQVEGADAQALAPAVDDSTVAVDVAAGGDGASTSTNSGSGDRTSGAAAVLGSASTSSASAAGGSADGMRGNPITDQVFDHVTRLVSRGDGTHRITLRLHPADLGEVKVVLTVKNGTVDVMLSAGAAAREALREGSPQLRSLLELTGATTGQVVVRDLGSSAVSAAAQQQAAGSAPDQGQQQSQDNSDGFADTREDGFDGFADGGFDEESDRSGDGADLLGGGTRRGAGDLAGARTLPGSGPSEANATSGSAHPSLFIPSRLDLNL